MGYTENKMIMKSPEDFYDNFTKKLILDYLLNNLRMSAAIKMVLEWIPKTSNKVLDIGCGIGWSTHEIASHFVKMDVKGIDLSSNSIRVANTLFKTNNSDFEKIDVTTDDFKAQNDSGFDAIVMIDVLEHIPLTERVSFIDTIGRLLSEKGRFIISCPTIQHQNYLKNYNKDGLQPVDEDITLIDIQNIAKQLGGDVVYFRNTSIGHTNDYFHAVIERDIKYVEKRIDQSDFIWMLESLNRRFDRVKKTEYMRLLDEQDISDVKLLVKGEKKKKLKKRIRNILGK